MASASKTPATEPGADNLERFRPAVTRYLSNKLGGGGVDIRSMRLLSGGAIQENWLLDVSVIGGSCPGEHRWVLRTDSLSAVDVSMSRADEYAVLSVVHEAGVNVPEPLWLCRDRDIIGREFFIMQAIGGTAAGHRLVRDPLLVPDRPRLCRELGRNLALIHQVRPPQEALGFLPEPVADPALASIRQYTDFLDALDGHFPVIEWGLRWLLLNKPEPVASCLIHRDFRTGNFMVDEGQLSGILDWEFTSWGDWREDIGWFTATCWRFGRANPVAGGIGELSDFMEGYGEVSPRSLSPEELRYWQVMAHVRWAIVAVQQSERHLSGQQRSLELALTGRMVPELELEILELTKGAV